MNVKTIILGAFAALLLSAGITHAQSCGVVRRPVVVNHSPVIVHQEPVAVVKEVVTPVAVPVFVPAFQFQYYSPYVAAPFAPAYAPPQFGQPAYAPPYAANVVNNGYGQGYNLPYNQLGHGYSAPTYGYPAVPQPMQAQPGPVDSQAQIRELAKALLDEMARQSGQGPDQGPPVATTPAPPAGQQVPPVTTPPGVPPPAQPKTGSPPGLPTAPTISPEAAAPYAIAALQQNCSACHTGPASKGEFIIFAQPGLFSPGLSWRTIIREIEAGRMPPRYSQYRITPDQVAAVRAWLSGI